MNVVGNHLYEHVTRMHPNDLADLFGCTSKAAAVFLSQIEDLTSLDDFYRAHDDLENANARIDELSEEVNRLRLSV